MAAVASVSVPTFSGLKAVSAQRVVAKSTNAAVRTSAISCSIVPESVKKTLVATGVSLLFASSAFADVILMGDADGALVFEPAEIEVASGTAITFKNNKGFPHNVVFDVEDESNPTPAEVAGAKLSHPKYFNNATDEYTITLTVPGEYNYFCEPHQGGGMEGKITVK